MLNKIDITRQLIEQLDGPDRPEFEIALKHWWTDWRADKGLRLTTKGRDLFDHLGYESHSFEISNTIVIIPKNLLTLERKLTCPYYIKLGKKSKFTLYGSKEATLFALFNNTEKFLTLLAQS
jgi:hypothetical protein